MIVRAFGWIAYGIMGIGAVWGWRNLLLGLDPAESWEFWPELVTLSVFVILVPLMRWNPWKIAWEVIWGSFAGGIWAILRHLSPPRVHPGNVRMLLILLLFLMATVLLTFVDCAVGWWGRNLFRSEATVHRLQAVFAWGGILTGYTFTILGIMILLHWVWTGIF